MALSEIDRDAFPILRGGHFSDALERLALHYGVLHGLAHRDTNS
jgi:hypothetical protein